MTPDRAGVPDFAALASEPLPENEQSSERLDGICDRITALLYRAHELAEEVDPDLGTFFVERMSRAFGGRGGLQ